MSVREDSPGAAASDPPKFREAQPSDSEDSDSDSHSSESPESSSEPEDEGQRAKQRGMIGPVIPPELKNMSTDDKEKTAPSECEDNYGPALPPSFTAGRYPLGAVNLPELEVEFLGLVWAKNTRN